MRNYFSNFNLLKIYFIGLGMVLHFCSYGQYDATIKSYIPVSPNAASLGKVSEASVSSFSGAANINIPIYSDTENALGYEVSCSYNTGGIKASETASSVGLGWTLNAGGAIVRSMRGAPDESLFAGQTTGFYANGVDTTWFYDFQRLQEINNGERDIESDIYFYNFMGYSGSFFFDHNQQIVQRIPTNLKIEVINTGYLYNKFLWKITSPDGTIYYFGDDTINDGVSDDAVGYSNQYVQPKDMVGAPNRFTPLVDSWYLVKVESFDKKSVLHYDYDEFEAYSFRDLGTSGTYYIDTSSFLYSFANAAYADLNPVLCTESLTPRLTKIRTSNRNITFTYSGNTRSDLDDWGTPGYHPRHVVGIPSAKIFAPKSLAEIAIKSASGTTFYKYNFHHSYFNSTSAGFNGTFGLSPQTDANGSFYTDMRRLKLDSVSLVANTETIHKHKFGYFNTNIQRRCSYGQDINGYPNGINDNITLLPKLIIDTLASTKPMINLSYIDLLADRSVSEVETKKAMLQNITFPNGGTRTFDYESHDHHTNTVVTTPSNIMTLLSCSSPASNCPGGTFYSSQVNMQSSNTTSFSVRFQAIRTIYDGITLPFDVQILVSTNGGSTYQIMNNFVLNSANMYTLDTILTVFPYSANGTYHFGIWAPSNRNVFMNLMVTQYTRTNLMANVKIGGLRIKSIEDNPVIGQMEITTYEYTQGPGNNNSSGFPISTPFFVNILPENTAITAAYTNGGSSGGGLILINPLCVDLKYRFTSGNSFALSSTQGSHMGYKKVRAKNGTNQGYMEYSHITDESFKAKPYRNFPMFPEYFVPDSLGKLDTVRYFDQSGTPINIEAYDYYEYDFMQNDTSFYLDLYPECNVANYVWGRYKNRSRHNEVSKKSITKDGVTTVTRYQYQGIPTHIFPTYTSVINSEGKTFSEEMYYTDSYTVNTNIKNQLLSENRWLPAWQSLIKVNNVIVDGFQTLYAYQNPSNGLLLSPTAVSSNSKIYAGKQNRREITWNTSGGIQDNGWQLQMENLKVDLVSGKPETVQGNGWPISHSLVWSTNGKLNTSTYGNFTSTYAYGSQHDLLTLKTNIDGTTTSFVYDPVLRPSTITQSPKNVITGFNYRYGNAMANKSFVKSRTYFPPTTDSALDSVVQVTYMDGLGREVQQIHKYGAPTAANDVISSMEYDNTGRPYRSYERIEVPNNHGAYYSGTFGGGFSQTLYEANPLDRVSQTTPPAWQTTVHTYGTNISALTNPEGLTYAASSLMRSTITDPDNKTTDIYSDKLGRAVLHRQRDASNTTDTWTVYDDKSRPVKIYPPGSSPATPDLIFEFRYDGDDNLIYKKVPDATAETYRYSIRNLQTAMRNATLQTQGRWLVTHYDDYGRPSKRGYHTGSDPGNTETPTIHTLLEEYFYDGFNGSTTNTAAINKGKLKKSRIKVLTDGGANSNWVETEYFYDIYGRVMTEAITNHLGGTETKMYTYDFADNITTEIHNISGPNGVNHTNKHTYDHQGRKKYDRININATGERTLAECNYDHKNQIIERNLGRHATSGIHQYLQSLDYNYNPQGWLTSINTEFTDLLPTGSDPCDPGTSGGVTTTSNTGQPTDAYDLFYLGINYNTPLSGTGLPTSNNGNITALKWRHTGQYNQAYSYRYDHLNRVTDARQGEIVAGIHTLKNQYNEKFQYDARGNILKLDRKGMAQQQHINTYCYQPLTIDSLTYVYPTGSNRLVQVQDKAPCPDVITLPQDIDRDINYAANELIIADVTTVACNVDMKLTTGQEIIILDSLYLKGGCVTPSYVHTYQGPCPDDKYTDGFNQQTTNGQYLYDNNGNLTYDPNKKLTTYYNHLNLPYRIVGAQDDEIQMLYSADGTLLQRNYLKNNASISKIDYLRGKELKNGIMESVFHSYGRVIKAGSIWKYEYYITDHLGNVRVTFEDTDGDGYAERKSLNDYYSFGLEWNNKWELGDTLSPENKYRYNGKEFVEEMGWDNLMYGARYYNPTLGIFHGIDLLSDQFPGWSPYNYTLNNPINTIDPDGKAPDWITDGKGNLIAEAGDNAQTLAKHMGTTYSHALYVLNSNGYTTTRKGNYDVLDINVGDKVNIAFGSGYSWSGSGTPSTISPSSSSSSNTTNFSTSDKLGYASDVIGGMGTGLGVQGGSYRLTDGKYSGNISLRYYQSGWQGGSRAQITTFKLGTLGTAAGRLGTFGTVGLGAYDIGSNAYSEGGFGTNTQIAAGRFGGSLGGGALGAAIGANFFGIGAIPGGIIGSVLFGAAGSKAGEKIVEEIQK